MERHLDVKITYNRKTFDLSIGTSEESSIQLSEKFIQRLLNGDLTSEVVMRDKPYITLANGRLDHLSTIIYMINYLQEIESPSNNLDSLGRFNFSCSYQARFNCAYDNLVLHHLLTLVDETPSLRDLKRKRNKSRLFVSHDIDLLVRNIWPDLKTSIKKLNFIQILRLLTIEIFKDQDRKLFNRILSINSKNDIKATFFWLACQKVVKMGSQEIENANYHIKNKRVRNHIKYLQKAQQEIGLHKSLSPLTYELEIAALDVSVLANRNHYLAGSLDQIWQACENADIKVDHSAGFSDTVAIRNSYAYPWQAFSMQQQRPWQVLEVPLHIMEVHFMKSGVSPKQAFIQVQDFIERNSENAIISLLWHNNYFSEIKFRDWITIYKDIHVLCRDMGIRSVDNKELLNDFHLSSYYSNS